MTGGGRDRSVVTDRNVLTNIVYRTSAGLAARQSIYRYAERPDDFQRWALDQHDWAGVETVVDVGCGNGGYLRRLSGTARTARLVGIDLSGGMLTDARAGYPSPAFIVADAQANPRIGNFPSYARKVAMKRGHRFRRANGAARTPRLRGKLATNERRGGADSQQPAGRASRDPA